MVKERLVESLVLNLGVTLLLHLILTPIWILQRIEQSPLVFSLMVWTAFIETKVDIYLPILLMPANIMWDKRRGYSRFPFALIALFAAVPFGIMLHQLNWSILVNGIRAFTMPQLLMIDITTQWQLLLILFVGWGIAVICGLFWFILRRR